MQGANTSGLRLLVEPSHRWTGACRWLIPKLWRLEIARPLEMTAGGALHPRSRSSWGAALSTAAPPSRFSCQRAALPRGSDPFRTLRTLPRPAGSRPGALDRFPGATERIQTVWKASRRLGRSPDVLDRVPTAWMRSRGLGARIVAEAPGSAKQADPAVLAPQMSTWSAMVIVW